MITFIAMSWSAAALAQEHGGCEHVRISDVVGQPGPGVLFLGERRGTRKDLARARRIVKKLSMAGPVTFALEAVPAKRQNVFDRLAEGKLTTDKLQEALGWEEDFGFAYQSYERLLRLSEHPNVDLLAVGQPVALRPEDETIPLPPGYSLVLADTMGDSPVPPELEPRLVQTMAWHDRLVAQTALDGWSGNGWLVVLVDRTELEGGLGAQWQAGHLTDATVDSVILADAGSRCYKGDRLLK